ncbi:MAG: 50S ribosomal protein L23 [Candidatus Micrarchaeia archaeon]
MALKYPITTEKAIALIELQNKMLFVVDKNATKKEIKEEFEKTYGVKVEKVTTYITTKGEKRAYIKLSKEHSADEIAAKWKIA